MFTGCNSPLYEVHKAIVAKPQEDQIVLYHIVSGLDRISPVIPYLEKKRESSSILCYTNVSIIIIYKIRHSI